MPTNELQLHVSLDLDAPCPKNQKLCSNTPKFSNEIFYLQITQLLLKFFDFLLGFSIGCSKSRFQFHDTRFKDVCFSFTQRSVPIGIYVQNVFPAFASSNRKRAHGEGRGDTSRLFAVQNSLQGSNLFLETTDILLIFCFLLSECYFLANEWIRTSDGLRPGGILELK